MFVEVFVELELFWFIRNLCRDDGIETCVSHQLSRSSKETKSLPECADHVRPNNRVVPNITGCFSELVLSFSY